MSTIQQGLVLVATTYLLAYAAMPATAQQPGNASSNEGDVDIVAVIDAWKQTIHTFDEWASIQQMYKPEQVAEMRKKMLEKGSHLEPAESDKFRRETDAKLQVLMSAEAKAARHWLANTLSVASDSLAERIKAKLPDIANENAAQLQAELEKFTLRESNLKQSQQFDETIRQKTIKSMQDSSRREAETRAKAQAAAQSQLNSNNSQPQTNINITPGSVPRYRTPYGPTLPYAGGRVGYRYW